MKYICESVHFLDYNQSIPNQGTTKQEQQNKTAKRLIKAASILILARQT